MKFIYIIIIAFVVIATNGYAQNIKRYDLYVTDTIVNFTGKDKHAIAVNGQIPMPTLEFTEGDIAEIYVHNQMKSAPTSLHWHGLFVPNKEDGVPFLTQMPILAGESFKYSFPIIQNGTYWYHSHQGMQEQIGMYGVLILKKKPNDITRRKEIDDLPSVPLVLSEWSDIAPHTIHQMLRNANDWGGIKKGSTQSYSEAIVQGHFLTKVINEWKRMQAMDVSDVYYDNVLINGKVSQRIDTLAPGSKVRLQIANGGSSSYFWLTYAGGKYKVVAQDGNDVMPVEVDRLILAPSETVDVIIEVGRNNQAFEFLATTEDRTQTASLIVGNGDIVYADKLPKLDYFAGMKMMNAMMNLDGSMKDMGMQMSLQTMDMNAVMYPELKSKASNEGGMPHAQMSKSTDGTSQGHNHDVMDHAKHTAMSEGMPHAQMSKSTDGASQGHNHDAMDHAKHTAMSEGMPHAQMSKSTDGTSQGHNHDAMDHAKHTAMSEGMPHAQMSKSTDSTSQGHNHGAMDHSLVTLNYNMLKSPVNTEIDTNAPLRELKFTLTGNMNRYVWSMDNKVVSEADIITIKKGERIRIELHNASMMRHPMHLHGHDFRVINQYGEYSPMKNVIDIMPMETNIIEFEANNEGDWVFHCHILYHMMAGMGRIFTYEDQAANPYITNPVKALQMVYADDQQVFLQAQNEVASNGNFGLAMLHNTRWAARAEWKVGYQATKGTEVELQVGRYLGQMQWFMPYIGVQYNTQKEAHINQNMFGQSKNVNNKPRVSIGFVYTLPLLIQLQTEIDHYGIFRMILRREDIPLTPRLRGAFSVGSDKEYMGGLKYVVTRNMSISGNYYSQYGFGGGISINY